MNDLIQMSKLEKITGLSLKNITAIFSEYAEMNNIICGKFNNSIPYIYSSIYEAIVSQYENAKLLIVDKKEILENRTTMVSLMKGSHIYFLLDGDYICYVGQTVNPASRISTHIRTKDFDSVYVKDVDDEDRLFIEALNIREYNPKYNVDTSEMCIFSEILKRIDI